MNNEAANSTFNLTLRRVRGRVANMNGQGGPLYNHDYTANYVFKILWYMQRTAACVLDKIFHAQQTVIQIGRSLVPNSRLAIRAHKTNTHEQNQFLNFELNMCLAVAMPCKSC